MINAANIFIKYGDRVLLDHVNLVVGPKDKMGLVGRNGAGKTTMLKILAGDINPDSGQVAMPKESTMSFLRQEMDLPRGKTVMAEALSAFAEAKKVEERLEQINLELGQRDDYESSAYTKLLEELSAATDRFNILGGHNMEASAERVLKGLGFKPTDFQRLTDEFSGGWQMRIELAKMLLLRPNFLLLDEPTNHLDIESIIWLEQFLKTYEAAVIVISHDKTFLDNVTQRTVEIELGKVYDYKASYSKYMEMRAERRSMQASAFKNQQRIIAEKERTITRFMAKATKTKMAQSMKKQLDKLERVEIDTEDLATMDLRFPPAPRSGRVAVEAEKLSKQYGDNLVLDKVGFKFDRGDRIAFVGQNGQGKTTLAKILVNEITASGGDFTLGHNIQIGYYAQDQSESLEGNLTLLQTLENISPPEMRTKLRSILGAFMFSGEDVEKKVSVLSGGERARLALACMLLRPFNLLVLDEPTNHLDMLSKLVLKQALQKYDGTVIVVSHDRDFLTDLTNRTLEFRDRQLYNYIGDVNAFLEKRAMDNMREVELATAKKRAKVVAAPKIELDRATLKKLQRTVQNTERKIEQLEGKITEFELKMSDPSFYEQPDSAQQLDKYQGLKKELEGVYEEWERAQAALDG